MDDDKKQTVPEGMTTANTASVKPAPTTARQAPVVGTSPRRFNKKLTILLAVVLVLVVGGSAALAYMFYNKPENVLSDALKHTVAAKSASFSGNVVVEPRGEATSASKLTVAFSGQGDHQAFGVTLQNTESEPKFSGGLIGTKAGDVYIKIDNAKQILDSFASDFGFFPAATLDPILAKIDNKWVKFTAEDTKNFSGNDCSAKFAGLELSKQDQNKVVEAFRKNMFVTVDQTLADETVNGRQSAHYRLSIDDVKTKAFAEEVKALGSLSNAKECFENPTPDVETEAETQTRPTVEVWIDRWTHYPTRLALSTDDNQARTTFTTDLTLNDNKKTEVPTENVVPLSDVQAEFQKLLTPTIDPRALESQNPEILN